MNNPALETSVSNDTELANPSVADNRDGQTEVASRPWLNWNDDDPPAENYGDLGGLLADFDILYRPDNSGDRLIRVTETGSTVPINKGAELAPVIVDHINVNFMKDGKRKGTMIPTTHLNTMLGTDAFLDAFPVVDIASPMPIYGSGFELAEPGYNDGPEDWRILYTGDEPELSESTTTIDNFLDVMAFATQADRTNAVAALLIIALRHRWPGQKPVILVTATKSHGGKDTILDFAASAVKKVSVSYQKPDWPVQKDVVSALKADPDIGVVVLENARLDGREVEIASAFIERLVTDAEPSLSAPGTGRPIRRRNEFVIAISTNDGRMSKDMMNRALPIHLAPVGDVRGRATPIGNPRSEFLPRNYNAIAAEARGMIAKWVQAGRPLDNSVQHPFTDCVSTIGGILRVNGYEGFLDNYSLHLTVDDPIRNALGLLGAERADVWLRPGDFVDIATHLGLVRQLIPAADRESHEGRRRGMGSTLSKHIDETFEVETEEARLTLRLQRQRGRFGEQNVHVRYRFETLRREVIPGDDDGSQVGPPEESDADVELTTLA